MISEHISASHTKHAVARSQPGKCVHP